LELPRNASLIRKTGKLSLVQIIYFHVLRQFDGELPDLQRMLNRRLGNQITFHHVPRLILAIVSASHASRLCRHLLEMTARRDCGKPPIERVNHNAILSLDGARSHVSFGLPRSEQLSLVDILRKEAKKSNRGLQRFGPPRDALAGAAVCSDSAARIARIPSCNVAATGYRIEKELEIRFWDRCHGNQLERSSRSSAGKVPCRRGSLFGPGN
jgi:hypothetical protein